MAAKRAEGKLLVWPRYTTERVRPACSEVGGGNKHPQTNRTRTLEYSRSSHPPNMASGLKAMREIDRIFA